MFGDIPVSKRGGIAVLTVEIQITRMHEMCMLCPVVVSPGCCAFAESTGDIKNHQKIRNSGDLRK